MQSGSDRFAEPEALLLVAAHVFAATGKHEIAGTHLAAAWDIYQRRLAGIDDARTQATYAALWFHRELASAVEAPWFRRFLDGSTVRSSLKGAAI